MTVNAQGYSRADSGERLMIRVVVSAQQSLLRCIGNPSPVNPSIPRTAGLDNAITAEVLSVPVKVDYAAGDL
jgi:hypothetical protein